MSVQNQYNTLYTRARGIGYTPPNSFIEAFSSGCRMREAVFVKEAYW